VQNDEVCTFEDSVARHLSRILSSSSHNVVISSATFVFIVNILTKHMTEKSTGPQELAKQIYIISWEMCAHVETVISNAANGIVGSMEWWLQKTRREANGSGKLKPVVAIDFMPLFRPTCKNSMQFTVFKSLPLSLSVSPLYHDMPPQIPVRRCCTQVNCAVLIAENRNLLIYYGMVSMILVV